MLVLYSGMYGNAKKVVEIVPGKLRTERRIED